MGTRAATSAPVAAVSSVLFGRSFPQNPVPNDGSLPGLPPMDEEEDDECCPVEFFRLLPGAVQGDGQLSYCWCGSSGRRTSSGRPAAASTGGGRASSSGAASTERRKGFYVEQFDRRLPERDGKQWNLRHAHKSMEPMASVRGRMRKSKSKGTKFATVKKMISKKTIKKYKDEVLDARKKDAENEKLGRNVPHVSSALFFS